MIRKIVTIDEDLCDGCGLCIPSCHEGALKIVKGKAKLVSDKLCDGLGDCLGHCPRGAIKIESRDAENYDEEAVDAHRQQASVAIAPTCSPSISTACSSETMSAQAQSPVHGGCPGAKYAQFAKAVEAETASAGVTPPINGSRPGHPTPQNQAAPGIGQRSQLTHWPVQLRLLPPTAPVLNGAKLLVTADCVPVAYADFHGSMLRDHAVVMTCPKFDAMSEQMDKLVSMIRDGGVREITIARMEVPCCGGIVAAIVEAHRLAGSSLPLYEAIIGVQGGLVSYRQIA